MSPHHLPRRDASAPVSRHPAFEAVLGLGRAAMRLSARHPVFVVAGIVLVGTAGIFAWNATMKQTSRHPAPLFAGQKSSPVRAEARPEQRQAEPASPLTTGTTRGGAPMPPARPSGPDAIGSIIRTSDASAKPAETKPKVADAKPRPAEVKKPVEAKKATEPKKVAEPRPAPVEDKARVASAQKALAKLGYGPLAADGRLGEGTRAALEKFERDKKLPVTGTLGPRTTKQLASLSGISVQ